MDEEIPFADRPLIVRWLDDGSSFVLVRFAILRLLGVVYFVAFASAFQQARALVGEHGLVPMQGRIAAPSLFQIASSDGVLRGTCVLGALLALAVIAGVTNAGVMLVLWLLQLSLANAGNFFWGFGWEMQLCETGMIAAFMCPMRAWRPFASAPPTATIWMMRWLIVRIMLGAGLIKIRGDSCWRELTCLVFHYETQPNPSPVSWLLEQAPPWFHTIGVLVNHFVELVAWIFVLGPRRARRFAGACFVFFQVTLIVSGNLSFLNWLTIVPALACFDDDLVKRFARVVSPPSRPHVIASYVYAVIVGILSIPVVVNLASPHQAMNTSFEPLRLVNTYGAFGSVSRVRDEIVIEGTRDGKHWLEYEFPCKPGDPMRRPCIVTPWHYRFDWQMWFAAMSTFEQEPWLAAFVDDLLRGDRSVEPLIAHDPFPDAPPILVRATLYRYRFTHPGEPGWWHRERLGDYIPPLAKDDPDLAALLRDWGLRRAH
ncbi:MAG TPA: lipase maturation factor family protein [Labilithrix sp.]